jgi:hypothetical protein
VRATLTIWAGFALLAAGAVLLIPLPEAGLPALAVGLRLLGRHYTWAKAANNKLDQIVRAGRRHWTRLPRPARFAILTLLAASAAMLIYVLST